MPTKPTAQTVIRILTRHTKHTRRTKSVMYRDTHAINIIRNRTVASFTRQGNKIKVFYNFNTKSETKQSTTRTGHTVNVKGSFMKVEKDRERWNFDQEEGFHARKGSCKRKVHAGESWKEGLHASKRVHSTILDHCCTLFWSFDGRISKNPVPEW